LALLAAALRIVLFIRHWDVLRRVLRDFSRQ
jgi:hypothetical protein